MQAKIMHSHNYPDVKAPVSLAYSRDARHLCNAQRKNMTLENSSGSEKSHLKPSPPRRLRNLKCGCQRGLCTRIAHKYSVIPLLLDPCIPRLVEKAGGVLRQDPNLRGSPPASWYEHFSEPLELLDGPGHGWLLLRHVHLHDLHTVYCTRATIRHDDAHNEMVAVFDQ